jgi:hypothetical protein
MNKNTSYANVKKLREYLDKEFLLRDIQQPVQTARYRITMDNDFLSPNGYITKKQHLEAAYTREILRPVSKSTATLAFTWDSVLFSQEDGKGKQELLPWTFAIGLRYYYYRSFSKEIYKDNEIVPDSGDQFRFGNWYEQLVNTPAVNLLYMLSWDSIMVEEFTSALIMENIARIGDVALVKSLSDSNVQLSFKGCSQENSFFKNGAVYTKFAGIGISCGRPSCVYEYRSVGRINVERKNGNAKQEGESFFLGKICIDMTNGDFLFADMTELLTVSVTNKQGKIVPIQKRRLVQSERIL